MPVVTEGKLTQRHLPRREGEKPLKRSLSGYEIESFLLNKQGHIVNADSFLEQAKRALPSVKEECAKQMIEIVSPPNQRMRSLNEDFVYELDAVKNLSGEEQLLYPFGTYPGKFTPKFREAQRYKDQVKIFGNRFRYAGMCCGFHQHYTLPRGLFDQKKGFLKYSSASKVNRTLIDSYNFLIAADPVLTLFMQSSPYVDGKHLAKDSRAVIYRGGKKLNFPKGVYTGYQNYGGLPPYKQTVRDLINTLKRRHKRWITVRAAKGIEGKQHILDCCWGPVKINSKGTLEYRGADANLPSVTMGVSSMLKFALRSIQQDFTLVTPTDMTLKEAFRLEDNMLFVPPHTLVRNTLQKKISL